MTSEPVQLDLAPDRGNLCWLRRTARALNCTPEDLADLTGLPHSSVSRALRGRSPRLERHAVRTALAQALLTRYTPTVARRTASPEEPRP